MKQLTILFNMLAMVMALVMATACNKDDTVDYTEYYDWRDRNNEMSVMLENIRKTDFEHTYFNTAITSLKEPVTYPNPYTPYGFPVFVHYFRVADTDSLAALSPRRDVHPYSTSTVSVHYTLYSTKSVYERMADCMKASGKAESEAMKDLLRNPGGQIDSIFFANADGNTLKADTIESSQVAFFSCTPNSVITGWGDLLQQMYIGDNVVCMIPWFLAYGQAGSGKNIDPYTNLFFRVELCDITKLNN